MENHRVPDHTAVRVALWRALHLEVDDKPPVFTDFIGAELVGEPDWRKRPDMDPGFSKSMRASIVTRARYVEDLVEEQVRLGVAQYVILGAGLDTFAQRKANLDSKLQIFEIDRPETQKWKQQRLQKLGFQIPENLHFVPVDFEAGETWWDQLAESGFDSKKPAVIVSTGVSLYLSKEANQQTFRQIAKLAAGSTFATTFMLDLDLLDAQERSLMEFVIKRAADAGTPFLSLFSPEEILLDARRAGFKAADYVSAEDLFKTYLAHRSDDLNAGHAEAFLLAKI